MSAFQNPTPEERKKILEEAKTIAVVGLSSNAEKVSYQISEAMKANGYRIIPINPTATTEILGEQPVKSISELPENVDIINVFRRSEDIPPIAEEIVKSGKTKVLWLQKGIFNEEAAQLCKENGIQVIMDTCIKVDHSLLFGK